MSKKENAIYLDLLKSIIELGRDIKSASMEIGKLRIEVAEIKVRVGLVYDSVSSVQDDVGMIRKDVCKHQEWEYECCGDGYNKFCPVCHKRVRMSRRKWLEERLRVDK